MLSQTVRIVPIFSRYTMTVRAFDGEKSDTATVKIYVRVST